MTRDRARGRRRRRTYQSQKVVVRGSKIGAPMSALGQKRTCRKVRSMSALPPKGDIAARDSAFTKYTSPQRAKLARRRRNIATRYFTAAFRYNASKNS